MRKKTISIDGVEFTVDAKCIQKRTLNSKPEFWLYFYSKDLIWTQEVKTEDVTKIKDLYNQTIIDLSVRMDRFNTTAFDSILNELEFNKIKN